MKPRLALYAAALCLAVPLAGRGEILTWEVGAGGLDWEDQGLVKAAVDLDAGFAQPSGFTAADNIVATLDWRDVGGTPNDFTAEGQARVWSNVAGSPGDLNLSMVDGDTATGTGEFFKPRAVNQTGRTFTFDLGASFPANRIAFYPGPDGDGDFIRAFEVKINDGRDFDSNGRPLYVLLRREELNVRPRVEISFPLRQLRFIELRVLSPNPFEIAELEVYGQGFVPRAQYLSQFIDFGAPVNFGTLRLEVERLSVRPDDPAQSAVSLEVRNGADQTPQIYYEVDPETQSETQIDFDRYAGLEPRKRTVRYDSENWSPWSRSLNLSQDGVFELDLGFLPGPRQYFQFNLSYAGTSADVMRVRRLAFTYARPLARSGLAEVALLDDPLPSGDIASTATGRRTGFVYGVLAQPGGNDAGFDGVRIETPERPVFLSFSLGDPANTLDPDSLRVDDGGLSVYFPSHRVGAGQEVPLWIAFETTPLLYSTFFRGWLLDTGGDLPQPLDPGDVGPQIGTNSLLVFGSLGQVLSRFALSSAVLTPNGDGRNDAVDLLYELVFLVEEAQVEVQVLDLAGRTVRRLFAGQRPAGRYAEAWDGRDGDGRAVAPGHYICAISVKTQNRRFDRARPLAVAY